MCSIRCGRRQHHFRITGYFQVSFFPRPVVNPDLSHLYVIFRRNHDLGMGFQVLLLPSELGPALGEYHFIGFCGAQGWLVTGGPDALLVQVADKTISSEMIAADVLTPTGNRNILPAAVAAAGITDHGMKAAIG